MKVRPLYDRVVARRLDPETRTRGGIVLPGSAAEKPNQGEVIAVGPGAVLDSGELRPLQVTVGDRVLFGKYTPSECQLGEEELLVLKESDILAIIDSKQAVEEAA